MLSSFRWRAFTVKHWRPILAVLVLVGIAIVLVVSRIERIPDFSEFRAGPERKAEFLAYLRPLVSAANSRVLRDRERLESLAEDPDPGWLDRRWLEKLADDYAVKDGENLGDAALIETLLPHLDIVPMSLALAQAATESGWGTSRFTVEANNLFGQWCYKPGCGLTPLRRDAGRTHEVELFATPAHAVASYISNINTHESYREFRLLRARMRQQNKPLSGFELAGELSRYSERGDAYVEEIQEMIRFNDLEQTR